MDILTNQWTPIYDVHAILTSIQSLLSDPNPKSPANNEAAKLYAENIQEYVKRVTECVENSWAESWICIMIYIVLIFLIGKVYKL